MAHYALLDQNNIVTQVIVGGDENDQAPDNYESWESYYSEMFNQKCLRTSYNTISGEHLLGGAPFRGNYAAIGDSYNEELDAFMPRQPFNSWNLDKQKYSWEPPIPYPENGLSYYWDEESMSWVED